MPKRRVRSLYNGCAGNLQHAGTLQIGQKVRMRNYGPRFSFFLLALAAAALLACGSSSPNVQSILVSPASADALNYPNGQVQFTAAGYSSPPSPTPLQVPITWGTCNGASGPSEITVSANGLAQCNSGASGTYFVSAFELLKASSSCNVVLACGEAGRDCFGTYGYAALTCP